jgi:signal transduction histidine kinase
MKLQTKVILLMIGILLLSGFLGGGTLIYLQKRFSESFFEKSALAVARAVRTSLEHSMLEAKRAHIQKDVSFIAESPGLNEVVIFNPQGMVAASAESSEIGKVRDDPEILEAIATGKPVTRREITYGRSELCVILPVANKPACQRCHDPGQKFLGAIEVGLDAAPLTAQLWGQGFLLGGSILAGVAMVIGVLTLILRNTLTRRLFRLAGATAKVAQGDYSVRLEEKGGDEISSLAHSFNIMAESLELRSQQLAELQRSLEDKVRERTLELEQKERVRRELLKKLISAQEEERARVARELHDEVGQGLTLVAVTCASAAQQLPSGRTKERKLFMSARETALGTLQNVRRIIAQLRPEALEDLGLPAALRWMTQERLKETGIEAEVDIPDVSHRPPRSVELALYRVAQEALNNVLRHSGATRVRVSFHLTDNTATLEVWDNGRGFDVDAVLKTQQPKEGWGLLGMQERLRPLEGSLDIESKPGQGTTIRATVPLKGGSE